MLILLESIQLPENLGAIARVMHNFGLTELRLITPHTSPLHEKAMATSAGAEKILEQARIFPTITDAAKDLSFLLGTCGHTRQGIRHYTTPRAVFEDMEALLHSSLESHSSFGVLFGCERTGLSQKSLSLCKSTITIPTISEFSSMNISHAVGIMAYEWRLAHENPPKNFMHYGKTQPAPLQSVHALMEDLIKKLDTLEYWRVPSKKPLMEENLRNLFFRMSLTEQEVQTLFGVFQTLFDKNLK